MPFPLNKAPVGLIELFRLRNLGQMPPGFGELLTPVVDVTEFYGALNKIVSGSAPTVGAITGAGILETFDLTAPIRLHAVSCALTVGAAAATNVTLSVRLRNDPTAGAISVTLAEAFYPALNIGADGTASAILGEPIVIPAGFTLTATASGTAAGADHSLAIRALIDVITIAGP